MSAFAHQGEALPSGCRAIGQRLQRRGGSRGAATAALGTAGTAGEAGAAIRPAGAASTAARATQGRQQRAAMAMAAKVAAAVALTALTTLATTAGALAETAGSVAASAAAQLRRHLTPTTAAARRQCGSRGSATRACGWSGRAGSPAAEEEEEEVERRSSHGETRPRSPGASEAAPPGCRRLFWCSSCPRRGTVRVIRSPPLADLPCSCLVKHDLISTPHTRALAIARSCSSSHHVPVTWRRRPSDAASSACAVILP